MKRLSIFHNKSVINIRGQLWQKIYKALSWSLWINLVIHIYWVYRSCLDTIAQQALRSACISTHLFSSYESGLNHWQAMRHPAKTRQMPWMHQLGSLPHICLCSCQKIHWTLLLLILPHYEETVSRHVGMCLLQRYRSVVCLNSSR